MTITGRLVHLDSRELMGRLETAHGVMQVHADPPTLKAMSHHFGDIIRVDVDQVRRVVCWRVG